MTAAVRTSGILLLSGAVAIGALFLTRLPRGKDPGPRASGSGPVTIEASLESARVLIGSPNTHMAVLLRADDDGSRTRPNLNLALVIDRSGSMHGEPLAQAKAAARNLIDRLRENDHFSVITYGSDVEVLVPNTIVTPDTVRGAQLAIDRIYDDGGTNLSGGLLAGRDEVLRSRSGGVARIVLISDGKANEGVISPDELAGIGEQTAEMGVSLTTVGVGLDFDERVMTRIAVAARGNYYYAERAADLGALFAQEMDHLGATVATDAVLEVTPAAGVELLEVYGYPMHRDGNVVRVPIADLHAGEQRKVVLRMSLRSGAPGRDADFASVRLRYTETKNLAKAESEVALTAVATESSAEVAQYRSAQAGRLIQPALTAHAIEEATQLYEEGNAAQAVEVMNTRKQQALEIARDLDDDQLGAEMEAKSDAILRNLSDKEAPQSDGGKRRSKENRKGAYDLYR